MIVEYLIELNTTGTFPDETDKTPMVRSPIVERAPHELSDI